MPLLCASFLKFCDTHLFGLGDQSTDEDSQTSRSQNSKKRSRDQYLRSTSEHDHADESQVAVERQRAPAPLKTLAPQVTMPRLSLLNQRRRRPTVFLVFFWC